MNGIGQVLISAICLLLSSCQTVIELQTDKEALAQALEKTGYIGPYPGNIVFRSEINQSPGYGKGYGRDSVVIQYPEADMLQEAGQAFIARTFSHDPSRQTVSIFSYVVLFYAHSSNDLGCSTPLADIEVAVRVINPKNKELLLDKKYAGKGAGKSRCWSMSAARDKQNIEFAIYRAILSALDKAMRDIVDIEHALNR